jgi:ABC-type lipoprotein release transport system permease subunit
VWRPFLPRATGGIDVHTIAASAACASTTHVLESVLWGVPSTDATTFAAIAATLLALAGLASLHPALRAAAINPMTILRGG